MAAPVQGQIDDVGERLVVGSKSSSGIFGEVTGGLTWTQSSDDYPDSTFNPSSYFPPPWTSVSTTQDIDGVEYHLLVGPNNGVGKPGPHLCAWEQGVWSCDSLDAAYAAGEAEKVDYFAGSFAPTATNRVGWVLSRVKGQAQPTAAWRLDLSATPQLQKVHSIPSAAVGVTHSDSETAWAFGKGLLAQMTPSAVTLLAPFADLASRTFLDAATVDGTLILLSAKGTNPELFDLVTLREPANPGPSASWTITPLVSTARKFDSLAAGLNGDLYVLGRSVNGVDLMTLHFTPAN